MPAPITVRPAARTDYAQWAPLWAGYNRFYLRVLPDEITQMSWARFFDAYEPMHALVAEQDGQLLGLAHYLFHRNTSLIEPVCYLQDLFTAEAERGQGVGRALIEAVYAAARQAGSTRVYWQTQQHNHTAMQLYDQMAQQTEFVQYRKQL